MKLDNRARQTLLTAAHWTIEHELGKRPTEFINHDPDPALREPRASFVTLRRHGKLRGCVGTLDVEQPLLDDVMHNAHAAAFHDPRFAPLDAVALAHLNIEISVLSAPQPLSVSHRTELLRILRPYEDGLILEENTRRATFLPSVWKTLPEPGKFLDALMHKAGLNAGYWSPTLHFFRYHTDSIQEENPR